MGELTQLLDQETSQEVFDGLVQFWNEHPEAILRGRKGLSTLTDPLGQKLEFLEKLRKTLETFTMGMGKVDLQIHRLGRNTGMKLESEKLDLGRFILVLGSPAFFETPMPTSGMKTGRAPTYRRVLHDGEAFLPMGDEVHILGDKQVEVFVKGTGRVMRTKAEFFDQFILIAAISLAGEDLRDVAKKVQGGKMEDMMKGRGLAAALTEVLKQNKEKDDVDADTGADMGVDMEPDDEFCA